MRASTVGCRSGFGYGFSVRGLGRYNTRYRYGWLYYNLYINNKRREISDIRGVPIDYRVGGPRSRTSSQNTEQRAASARSRARAVAREGVAVRVL